MDKASERRLAENEVIFRESNKNVQEFIEEEGYPDTVTLHFYCECSRAECRERVELTVKSYRELHQNKKQFVIVAGHEIPEIEKVVKKEDGYLVVEKFGDLPDPKEIDAAIKKLNILPDN